MRKELKTTRGKESPTARDRYNIHDTTRRPFISSVELCVAELIFFPVRFLVFLRLLSVRSSSNENINFELF